MPGNDNIILAIDPSLRGTGYAMVRINSSDGGRKPVCLEYGVVRLERKLLVPACLLEIHRRLTESIDRHQPGFLAIESTIYVQSHRTAIVLGAARGVALLAAAQHGLEVEEFAPRKVKLAVVGRGAADKQQVAFMVRALFGLEETPPPDAADALAIALTCSQSRLIRNMKKSSSHA